MDNETIIQLTELKLMANIEIPQGTHSMVIFAHGSGSSRLSPRNRYVAHALNSKKIATCLFDLLTTNEEVIDNETREYRFNIPLLAARLAEVTKWLANYYKSYHFKMGYFGSSTGAAAALVASTQCQGIIKAIVSRGGRPDLAGNALSAVCASTLLIVGERDEEVIELNRLAFNELNCEKEMVIIPTATHLFQEPGTLEEVIYFCNQWLAVYL